MARAERTRRLRGQDGFTLVETLVALVVLTSVAPALYKGAVMLRTGAGVVDDRARSEIVARSLLDAALSDRSARQPQRSGTTDGRRWSVATDPLDLALPRLAVQTDRPGAGVAPPRAEAGPAETWAPVRIRIRVETMGQPLVVESVTLVRAGAS